MEKEPIKSDEYFSERFFTENWDKHDKKAQRYDYYDMVDFGDQYVKRYLSSCAERKINYVEIDGKVYSITNIY